RRGVAWLDSAPPGRRELVIAAPLTIGSLGDADIAEVPRAIGIRFERTAEAPGPRSIAAPALSSSVGTVQRTLTVVGTETSVRDETSAGGPPLAAEIAAPRARQARADAALAAVRALRVPVPPPHRR